MSSFTVRGDGQADFKWAQAVGGTSTQYQNANPPNPWQNVSGFVVGGATFDLTGNADVAPTPELGSLFLIGTGLLGFCAVGRHKRRPCPEKEATIES
jgi:hypothetical protein